MIECERLLFIRRNLNVFRADKYVNLQGVVSFSDGTSNITGRRIIIPSTYPGSLWFMNEILHDAIGTCKTYGYLDVFIKFTCNSRWPEITRFFNSRCLRLEDRPDILS